MDDFVILSPDKEQLRNWLARIEHFLREELKLEFNPKTTILAAKNGIDFVGYKHRATHRNCLLYTSFITAFLVQLPKWLHGVQK